GVGHTLTFDDREGAIEIAGKHMRIERRYLERAWEDHTTDEALPSDLRLERRSIETALSMMKRDRGVRVAQDASPEKYVDTTYLYQAYELLGLKAEAM
ncbi:nitrate ABC transporter substrate-binding protein, partial [Pusillimonas sp. T2]